MSETRTVGFKIDGCPPFPAPWIVQSYLNSYRMMVHLVRAADGLVVIQPTEDLAHCEAVARSRNEGTDEEALAYLKARYEIALKDAAETTERVRKHFQAEMDKVIKTNASLQNSIVESRKSGRTDRLPAWCQPDDQPFAPSGDK